MKDSYRKTRLAIMTLTLFVGLSVLPAQAQTSGSSIPTGETENLAAALDAVLDEVRSLAPLQTVILAHQGRIVAERGYRGHTPTAATNIKSASTLVISALVGIAIDKGVLEGPDQAVAALLPQDLPSEPDPRMRRLTLGHLLSMQARLGLRRPATASENAPPP